jgi:SSS family solute:Na+ symporter
MWFGFSLLAYVIMLVYALRLSQVAEAGFVSEYSYRFADSNIGSVLGVLTFSATLFSTFTLLGLPDLFRNHGVGTWIFLGVTNMAMAFLALWFGLKVREKISVQEFESVSEMLAETYHADWVRFIYWAGIFVFLLPYVAIQIKGVSSFLSVAFPVNIPNWSWSLGILLAIIVYSHLGGLKAIIYNDAIQGMILLTITLLIAALCLDQMGGWGSMFEQIEEKNPKLLSIPGPKGLLNVQFLLASFLTMVLMPISQPQLFARFSVMRDERSMIEMVLGTSVFIFLIMTPTITIGMYGALNYPDLPASEFWVNTLIRDQPEIVGALALVGILAAAMSTADSQLFALESEVSPTIQQHSYRKLPLPIFAIMAFGLAVLSSSELVLLATVSFAGTSLLAPMILLAVLSKGGEHPPLLIPVICGLSLLIYLISLLSELVPQVLFGYRLELLLLSLNAVVVGFFYILREQSRMA